MANVPAPVWFEASEDRLFLTAVRTAASLGYSLKHSDPTARIISFNTGISMRSWAGQDMSVAVVTGQGGRNGIVVGGNRAQLAGSLGGPPQFFDWGEKGKVTRTFLDAFERTLPAIPEPVEKAPTTNSRAAIFEPDGVYCGIPYRATGSAVEALMNGMIVRFQSVDHFVAAATGRTAK